MKPVSDYAFCEILESYLDIIHELVSHATKTTLDNIISDTNPDDHELSDFHDFIEDCVCDIYKWTSTTKGLKGYLIERLNNEDENIFKVAWSIGDYYEIEGKKYVCDYKDMKSFLDDVNLNQAVQIIQKCWGRACITDQPFSEDELIELLKNAQVQKFTKDMGSTLPEIKSGKYPEYIEELLPLSHFESLIEQSTEEYKKKLAENDIEPREALEVEKSEILFFNENFVDILMYFYETFGEDTLYLEEIAFGRGYSVNEVKEHCNLHYRDRFRFKEERLNEKLLEQTRHELATKVWPEGQTAADWWAKKAKEKKDDKNFLIFSENMVKFHLKEIRGSYILDCLKDLPLEEKARIIKEAKETCEWFIK